MTLALLIMAVGGAWAQSANPKVIELTPDADKKVWTLDKMPANDVELQVEYYDPILTLAANNSEWGTASVVFPDLKTKVTKYNLLGGTAGYSDDEALSKLFDGDTGTKWCCEGNNSFVEFSTDNAIRVVSYILTTANDNDLNPGRNPKSWLLKGKLDENDEWKIIATVNNDTKMKNVNYTPYEFDVDKPGTYKYFRFEIEETTGSNVLQLSEMNLLKSEINGVIDNGDGTYNVKSGTQLDIKAIPAEGYHFDAWSNNEEGYEVGKLRLIIDEDKEITAIFAENEYNITFSEGTNPDPENPEWTATPNPAKTKQTVTVKYNGAKKVLGVKAEKKAAGPPEYYDKLTVTVRTQGEWSCASGPQATFIGQTITEEQAIALAKYQASKSGNNTVVFYKKESWQMYYAKSDGTTSYGDVGTSMGLDGYDVYYVAQ